MSEKISEYEYHELKTANAPQYCQRCYVWKPSIRVIDKTTKTVTFICSLCKDEDNNLKYKNIMKKK